jgi:hypothetical protein
MVEPVPDAEVAVKSKPRLAFQRLQYTFAAHLRDPDANPAPGAIEARRMRIYAELFYNNMQGYLANGFPVLCSLYAEADWHGLVRSFYARHQSHSPQFYQIGAEFLEYLQHEHVARECDPPFLLELAHYEWVEMILAIDPTEPDMLGLDPNGDLLEGCPVVTPWLQNLAYQYDVQRISPSYQPTSPPPQPTFVAVYRKQDQADEQIVFLELNAMTAGLLQQLIDDPQRSGQEQLLALAAASGQDAQTLLKFGADILTNLRDKRVLLGARPI